MYRYSVKNSFGSVKQFTLTSPPAFALPVEEILSMIDKKDRLLFICSPNNPTGNQFKQANVLRLIKNFPGIVAVDETYGPFSDYSLVKEINRLPNVVIIRSFSKAYGLAGMRIGYAISNTQLMQELQPFLPIYNVNTLSIELAKIILDYQDIFAENIELIKEQREKIFSVLQTMDGITPYPSKANFILFQTKNISASILYQLLIEQEISVRQLTKYIFCKESLRFTISSPKNNRRFLDTLKEIIGKES
jgi:histidinol-phosphate aminotransferase